MTDPLGQSQVIPYLEGLSNKGIEFTLISAEKPDRLRRWGDEIRKQLLGSHIDWRPISFTSSPPFLSKLWDLYRMKKLASRLVKDKSISLVHCRSYVACEVGLYLKEKYGLKLIFDMRGFWADERVDSGHWDQRRLLYRILYKNFKDKEKKFIRESDAIISLSEAGKKEIESWSDYRPSIPLSVIPCSVNFESFAQIDQQGKKSSRAELKLPEDALVMSYLGSVGGSYLLDEMMTFFKLLHSKYSRAYFLFLSSQKEVIESAARRMGVDLNFLRVEFCKHQDIPRLLAAADFSLFFIKPSYSKKASCPTKFGELCALGIPVITNSGVGDMNEFMTKHKFGVILNDFSPEEMKRGVESVTSLLTWDSKAMRESARPYFDMTYAVDRYFDVYQSLGISTV